MTTAYPARASRLSRSLEKAFGEQFMFSAVMTPPSGDVNLPKVADPSKPSFTVAGIFEAIADKNWPTARGSNPDDFAMRRSVVYPSVSVDAALLVPPNWVPFEKCLCTRVLDGAVYEVAKALPDLSNRITFYLSSRMKP